MDNWVDDVRQWPFLTDQGMYIAFIMLFSMKFGL